MSLRRTVKEVLRVERRPDGLGLEDEHDGISEL